MGFTFDSKVSHNLFVTFTGVIPVVIISCPTILLSDYTPIMQCCAFTHHKYVNCLQVLDVDNVDLVMGKVMDEGPVLAVSFQSQQIMCLRNSKGEVGSISYWPASG